MRPYQARAQRLPQSESPERGDSIAQRTALGLAVTRQALKGRFDTSPTHIAHQIPLCISSGARDIRLENYCGDDVLSGWRYISSNQPHRIVRLKKRHTQPASENRGIQCP